MASSKRAAHGSGTIRKKTVTRNGQDYTYWEARITTGYDTGTGRQKQRSVTGKTQKEVREKLQALAVEVNSGTYRDPGRVAGHLGSKLPGCLQAAHETDLRKRHPGTYQARAGGGQDGKPHATYRADLL